MKRIGIVAVVPLEGGNAWCTHPDCSDIIAERSHAENMRVARQHVRSHPGHEVCVSQTREMTVAEKPGAPIRLDRLTSAR